MRPALELWRDEQRGLELLGICPDYPGITPPSRMHYDACLAWDSATVSLSSGMALQALPGGVYAVFSYRGRVADLERLHAGWTWIYDWWLPHSGYTVRPSGAYELYRAAGGPLDDRSGEVEFHVPIA
jgi:DNA gyrase inhibitor GyrI